MEVAYEAIEDSGLRLRGTDTGVFIGAGFSDHSLRTVAKSQCVSTYTTTSTAMSICANRLSYVFDLRGPSMVVDTACSSTGSALAAALRHAECETLIVGGVSLMLNPAMTSAFSKLGVLSRDGCKSFCESADGYVRSEGVGVMVLKRYEAAVRDGDKVYA